jgi:hypothetical protein
MLHRQTPLAPMSFGERRCGTGEVCWRLFLPAVARRVGRLDKRVPQEEWGREGRLCHHLTEVAIWLFWLFSAGLEGLALRSHPQICLVCVKSRCWLAGLSLASILEEEKFKLFDTTIFHCQCHLRTRTALSPSFQGWR